MNAKAKAFLGCDVHQKNTWFSLAVVDPNGVPRRLDLGQVPTQHPALQAALENWQLKYSHLWPPVAVLETGDLSLLVHDVLLPFIDDVWVVDPFQVRQLRARKTKTDREDAWALAEMAARGWLRPLFVPSPAQLGARALMRVRRSLIKTRTAEANRLRSLANNARHPLPKAHVWTRANLALLAATEWPNEPYRAAVEAAARHVQFLTAELRTLYKHLRTLFDHDPHAQLLATLPGCDRVLSLTLSTEIGDISRFRSAAALRSFAALAPRGGESAGRSTGLSTASHGNRYLRWAFGQIANDLGFLSSEDEPLALLYRTWLRKLGRHPHKEMIAKAVVASELCDIVYAMLRHQRPYEQRWPAGHLCPTAL